MTEIARSLHAETIAFIRLPDCRRVKKSSLARSFWVAFVWALYLPCTVFSAVLHVLCRNSYVA